MADVYEQNLAQKSSLTTSDYIRVVGSDNVSYKQPINSVGDITKTRVFLASSSNITDSNIDNFTESGIYQGYFAVASIGTGGWGTLTVSHANNAVIEQTIVTRNYIAQRHCENGTWSAWVVFPTRAEIDAVSTRTDITSSVTVNSKLTVNEFHVYKTGKVVSVLGTFTATDSIPNGDALISGLPTSGIGRNDICPMLTPVRASYWSTTPSKYHFQSLRNTEIVNGTTTLASGDVIQINLTYLAQ